MVVAVCGIDSELYLLARCRRTLGPVTSGLQAILVFWEGIFVCTEGITLACTCGVLHVVLVHGLPFSLQFAELYGRVPHDETFTNSQHLRYS